MGANVDGISTVLEKFTASNTPMHMPKQKKYSP